MSCGTAGRRAPSHLIPSAARDLARWFQDLRRRSLAYARDEVVFGASGILLALALTACEDSGARPVNTIEAPDSADQVLEGFTHYVTTDGVRRSRVEADTAYFYEATQVTNLVSPKVTFYDLKGAESSTLTAKSGTYRWQDGSMEARDNVVVVSPDGRRLATQRLRYDSRANQISTDQHFTFDRAEEHLEGNSFRSDPDFKNVVTDRPRGVAGDGMLLPGQRGEQ